MHNPAWRKIKRSFGFENTNAVKKMYLLFYSDFTFLNHNVLQLFHEPLYSGLWNRLLSEKPTFSQFVVFIVFSKWYLVRYLGFWYILKIYPQSTNWHWGILSIRCILIMFVLILMHSSSILIRQLSQYPKTSCRLRVVKQDTFEVDLFI